MNERFKIHLQENFPEIQNKKLLLAVSGGIDSMVLLDLLHQSNAAISLAHCNFKLRAQDADTDEEFVRSKARQYKIKIHVIRFDTKTYASEQKCSVQMAARDLRYNWFKELLTEHEYDYLLTAHHLDDNIETFFINLSRGTGIEGLCGIPERSGSILRPLLRFSRKEINDYAKQKNIDWREDLSNQDTKYLRNKIRKELVPLLKEINPSFLETFTSSIDNLKGAKGIIEDRMKIVREDVITKKNHSDPSLIRFDVDKLLKYSNNTAYLYQLFYPYGFQQWEDIRSLLKSQSGKQIFSKTHRLVKNRSHLVLSNISPKEAEKGPIEIEESKNEVTLDSRALKLETVPVTDDEMQKILNAGPDLANFDKDLLTFPLIVRKWEKGDYFYPMGMKGKKKLSKFFKDEKYSLLDKENIWLLCSGRDIIWIIGKRIDNRFKITDKTKTILKATLQT